jgi:ankyrin repeat protein
MNMTRSGPGKTQGWSLMALVIAGGIACLIWTGCGPATPSTSLSQAVEKGDLKIVQQHIAAKSDLNKTNYSGWTPLHLAAMKGDVAIAKVLIDAGADPKRKGKDGKTPLDVAREKSQSAMVKFLQEGDAKTGRRLMDGGLGVQETLDIQ